MLSMLLTVALAIGDETCASSAGCSTSNSLLQRGVSNVSKTRPAADVGSVLRPKMQSHLNTAMEAQTYEVLQSAIRSYLREAFDLKNGRQKLEAVNVLSSALKTKAPAEDHDEEKLTPQDIDRWLEREFMEEALFEHVSMMKSKSKKKKIVPEEEEEEEEEVPAFLLSRSAEVADAFHCNPFDAIAAYFKTGGSYGNWCGRNGDTGMKNFNRCVGPKKTRHSGILDHQACADAGLDAACTKHDWGTHYGKVFGSVPVALCQVDRDFKETRVSIKHTAFVDGEGNKESEAIDMAKCLHAMLPCLRYETRRELGWCTKWWGGYPCYKTLTDYFQIWPWGKPPAGGCGPKGCYRPGLHLKGE